MKSTIKINVTFDIVTTGLTEEEAHIFSEYQFKRQVAEILKERGATNVVVNADKPIIEEE